MYYAGSKWRPTAPMVIGANRTQLLVFFFRIALFAGLGVFLGFDTALVFALFPGGFSLLAAGFRASEGKAAQKGDRTSNSSECFHLCFPLFGFAELDRANLLAVFFLRIALFTRLAVFGGFDAAFVSAFFAGGFGFFAAGFSASKAHAGEKSYGAGNSGY